MFTVSREDLVDVDYEPPQGGLEETVAQILAEILDVDRVGRFDSFYDFGGTSLQTIRICTRIGQLTGRQINPALLFEFDVLADFVSQLPEPASTSQQKPDLRIETADPVHLDDTIATPIRDDGPIQADEHVTPAATEAAAGEWYPLSSTQLSMWLLAQAGASHAAYTVAAVYEIFGSMDRAALRAACVRVLARHESLRTAYGEVAGEPMQRVLADCPVDWTIKAERDENATQSLISEFVQRDFDLAAGRLVRFMVIERAPDHHLIVVSAHHIALDGWSLTVLINDLIAGYDAELRGQPADVLASEQTYKEYAVAQQRMLQDSGLADARSYWSHTFVDVPEPLDLPTDRPRPAVRSYRGAVLRRTVSPQVLANLKSLCRGEGATLYAGISAVLRVIFFRYTGQQNFVLGTSALGRPPEALHDQIGCYVNGLALREEVTPDATFTTLLRKVQRSLAEAFRHSDYPFARVVQDIDLVTPRNRNPLFDVMVMMDPGWGTPTSNASGLQLEHVPHPIPHTKMDLTLYFVEQDDGLAVTVEYATDLYDEARVDRLLDHFETLVTGLAVTPDAPVEELEFLPAAERELVLAGFNATDAETDTEVLAHQLFEHQAANAPERIAVVDDHTTLTFAELNDRANALAWSLLQDHGVQRGHLVALYLERSVDLPASILAVFKAGGAYLPLSTTDPHSRIADILADSGAQVIITDNVDAAALATSGQRIVHVAGRDAVPPSTPNPPSAAGPDDVAYCIYTSGSTGRPNGVLIEHRGLVNRLRWMADELTLNDQDVVLQKTPYVFDVSVWELLLPGIIGARLVMLMPGGQSDPSVIHSAIQVQRVTVLHFVPSMLAQYLSVIDGGFAGVRHVICSGEELSRDLVNRFLSTARGCGTRLHNYYGPTEATIDVSRVELSETPDLVTIGRPAANTRMYILDRHRQPCPVGVDGELYISGVQVARGYLNRPEKSVTCFAADPFRDGARMYRTGDRGRWQEGGQVLYLGRGDGQIKLRGIRIELGEIEHALAAQPGVRRAVAMIHGDLTGADALWAFVENQTPGAPMAAADLRRALENWLPDYMVPTYFVSTDAIPVTPNGKVDRRALMAMSHTAHVAANLYVAPRTEVEKRLAMIWTELLAVEQVGAEDDFFTVGGNSLSALQLSTRIARDFGVQLKLAPLFTHRTIVAQAELIAQSEALVSTGRPMVHVPRDQPHVLSFAQKRMWFLHILEPDNGAYNIPLLIRLRGTVDPGILAQGVASLADRHEMLRTTFLQEGGEVFQIVRDDLPVPFEVCDLTASAPAPARDEALRLVRGISSEPFDLERGAPFRVVLLRVAEDEWELLIVVHHVAGDGWTLRLMVDELTTLYAAHASDAPIQLPAPAQYLDYAAVAEGPAHQAAVEDDLVYWTERLVNAPVLELPTCGADAIDLADPGSLTVEVRADIGVALRELAARTATTPFEITMTALNLELSRLGDADDVVVGFPVVARPSIDLERTVGLFLNTLVLRTDLSGEPTFATLLRRVSDGVREAYEHQTAPFELLVERLNPERAYDRTPLFDVLLNYLGDMAEDLEINGVTAEVDDHAFHPLAKFPLTFYVRDRPDGGMLIDLVYRADLFSRQRALTIATQLVDIIGLGATFPDHAVTSFALEAGAAKRQRAELEVAQAHPAQTPVPDLIAQVAMQHPDRVAIRQGERTLTYADLVARSEAVARRLIARGCSVGDVVGITGPRGIGFVIGLLGAWRSGAIAFPLDPALPEGRRRHLLEIARADLFVKVADGAVSGITTVDIDNDGCAVTEGADAPEVALPALSEADPAYLIFTSGTTGVPRGVLGRHGGLSHFLRWQAAEFGIGEDDRCSQLTSVSFDVMLRDTFLALVSGGTLVVPEEADEIGGKAIFRWLNREGVTVLHAAPTVLHSWLLDADVCPGKLRLTFTSGEPIKAILVENLNSRCPRTELICLYGTTETTLAKSFYRVPAGPLPSVMPSGLPLPQTQILVMRDNGVLAGVGEIGEIVIRTPFRTLGYLHDPEATAASFIVNPLREDGDDWLHRSGDLGRLRPDGLIDVVGRADHQVKISGVRIQPAEIENLLFRHPAVSAAIVVAHKDALGEARLVAYVVPEVSAELLPSLDEVLHAHLAGLLPRAMIPGEFIAVERIPTNANGKPDRAALPAPQLERSSTPDPDAAPRNELERQIRDVWTIVLDGRVPGVDDNFFALGGTSLKLLRLYGLLEERYPGTFRIAQLFTHRTIATQAAMVEPLSEPELVSSEHDF